MRCVTRQVVEQSRMFHYLAVILTPLSSLVWEVWGPSFFVHENIV